MFDLLVDPFTCEPCGFMRNGDADEETQEELKNHPLLQGVPNAPTNPGRCGFSVMTVTPTLLMASGQTSDGTWSLFGIDKNRSFRFNRARKILGVETIIIVHDRSDYSFRFRQC